MRLFILGIFALLAAACSGGLGSDRHSEDDYQQRSGASAMTTIRPTIIDRADLVDECQHQMEYESLVADNDYYGVYSWQVTANEILDAEQEGRGYRWRLGQAPEGKTALILDSAEATAWLCGPEGEYRIEVTTYLGDSYHSYTMQVTVDAP